MDKERVKRAVKNAISVIDDLEVEDGIMADVIDRLTTALFHEGIGVFADYQAHRPSRRGTYFECDALMGASRFVVTRMFINADEAKRYLMDIRGTTIVESSIRVKQVRVLS